MYFEPLQDAPHRRTFLPSVLLHVSVVVLSIVLWKASPAALPLARSSVALLIPARDRPTAATQTVRRTDLPVRRFEFVPPKTVAVPKQVTLPAPPITAAPPSRPAPAMAMPVEVPVQPPPKSPSSPPRTGLFETAESRRASAAATSPPVASAGFNAPKTEPPATVPPVHTAIAGFGAAEAAHATSVPTASTVNAGFAAAADSQPPAVTARQAPATGPGFAAPTVSHLSSNTTRAASSVTGFTAPAVSQPPATASPAVKSGSFAAASVHAPTARSRTETAQPTEVEILYKPKPVYTDEARRLKIEGEVVLDVIFTASGEVKVLRVSKGLGHGLDEAAIQAAAHIRFKPAERDGSKVDSTASARITFSLAF